LGTAGTRPAHEHFLALVGVAYPQPLAVLLVERHAGLRPADLEPQAVAAPGRDLADGDGRQRAVAGFEHGRGHVLAGHRLGVAAGRGRGEAFAGGRAALGDHGLEYRADFGETLAADP